MKTLLCHIPMAQKTNLTTPQRPIGLFKILNWMEKNDYEGNIYDIRNLKPSEEEMIEHFKKIKPDVVGFSAVLSWCYPNVKRISKILRELFPNIWIITGGHLTSSSNVVLAKTENDFCIVGDGEIPFVKLLNYIKLHPDRKKLEYEKLNQIKGLAYLNKNNKLVVTGNAEQLPQNELEFPNYDRFAAELELFGGKGFIHKFFEPLGEAHHLLQDFDLDIDIAKKTPSELKFFGKDLNINLAIIETSHGCVSRCTFCQRAHKGYSVYQASGLEAHLIGLKEKYNVGAIYISDENFGSSRKQAYEIAKIMKKLNLIWYVNGARCRSVTYEDLKFYKENGLLAIKFGIESGSQKMLDIMEKKVTTDIVFQTIADCVKLELHSPLQALIMGMPGESRTTVTETAEFVSSLRFILGKDWNITNTFLAIAIPGTPLYEYSQQVGLIGTSLDEEEEYLIRLNENTTEPILSYVNKTEFSNKEVNYWRYLYRYAGKKFFVDSVLKNSKSIKDRLSQIYEKCVMAQFHELIVKIKHERTNNKDRKFIPRILRYISFMANFLLSLSVLVLPRSVLFYLIKKYANLKFYSLVKKYKSTTDKQRHNLFVKQSFDTSNDLVISEDRISKTTREIDRSLRTLVMNNRKQMNPPTTEEEKGMQVLAQGQ